MAQWNKKLQLKHLFTENEDHESVQKSMNAVADEIDKAHLMPPFSTKKFRSIPAGDEYFSPVDYANKLLDKLYDYADEYRVWIE